MATRVPRKRIGQNGWQEGGYRSAGVLFGKGRRPGVYLHMSPDRCLWTLLREGRGWFLNGEYMGATLLHAVDNAAARINTTHQEQQ